MRFPDLAVPEIPLKGEKGTGARGAPVPVVGLLVKFKRAECPTPASRRDEGRVNSP